MAFVPDKRFYYTRDEMIRLFRAVKEGGNLRDYVLFKLLFLTGRRISELIGNPKRGILGLTPNDIDWNSGLITWTIEKRGKWEIYQENGKKRRKLIERDRVSLKASQYVMALLREYLSQANKGEHDRIFPISEQYVHRILKNYLDMAGIRNKKHIIHGLRHSFAILFLKHAKTAEDIRKLQKTLAHLHFTTTEGYLKFKELDEGRLLDMVAMEFQPASDVPDSERQMGLEGA
jgi:site-specific recombinase XerD